MTEKEILSAASNGAVSYSELMDSVPQEDLISTASRVRTLLGKHHLLGSATSTGSLVLTDKGRAYLDRLIYEEEQYNGLIKRLEAVERAAAASEAMVKEQSKIADAAVATANLAKAEAEAANRKSIRAVIGSCIAFATAVAEFLLNHWDSIIAMLS